ncbi:unnamed protein product [Lactuca saligna]|uniref:Uncharacterized protein n=1 Tax=Lactuca saligna TaxID=75948 RepID=A0AA36EFH1_LACSI|nr:unnamed protein product [Lactuca saligna]
MLLIFYLKYGQPRYKIWNLKKLVAVKTYAPIPIEHFTNIKFRDFRGVARIEEDFTLENFPCMILNDWISLFMILSKDEAKYESIVSYVKIMLICYIHEVTKLDVEIAMVLKKKPIVDPKEETIVGLGV